MLQKIGIILLLLVTSLGCSSKVPDWILAPANDSVSHFYSVGSGPELEAAKNNALDNLTSRLIVTVNNVSTTEVNKQNNQISQSYSSISEYQAEELAFFKVQVVTSYQGAEQMYTQIRVPKKQVFQAIYQILDDKLLPLLEINLDEKSKVLANGLLLDEFLSQYQKYLSLLSAYRQDIRRYERLLAQFKIYYRDYKTSTSFEVTLANSSTDITAKLTKMLARSGFSTADNKDHLQVIVVGPTQQHSIQNQQYATKLSGDILYVLNNELIHSKAINIFEYGQDEQDVKSQINHALSRLFANSN